MRVPWRPHEPALGSGYPLTSPRRAKWREPLEVVAARLASSIHEPGPAPAVDERLVEPPSPHLLVGHRMEEREPVACQPRLLPGQCDHSRPAQLTAGLEDGERTLSPAGQV